jgi:hypothetical protein
MNGVRFPLSIDDWLGVLEIGKKYTVDSAIKEAYHHLTHKDIWDTLSPGALFRIVWEFQMEDLYEDATTKLLAIRPFPRLDKIDLLDLEEDIHFKAQEIFEEAKLARSRLVSYVPDFRHSRHGCMTIGSKTCQRYWREAYTTYTRLLAETDNHYSSSCVLDKLTTQVIQGMNPLCQDHMMDYIRPGFLREGAILEVGKSSLMTLLRHSRPTKPRRRFTISPLID